MEKADCREHICCIQSQFYYLHMPQFSACHDINTLQLCHININSAYLKRQHGNNGPNYNNIVIFLHCSNCLFCCQYVEIHLHLLALYCCRYGLIIPSKAGRSKSIVNPVSVFANDDDDEVCKDSSVDCICLNWCVAVGIGWPCYCILDFT